MKTTILKGIARLKTKKIWAGIYGGHYSIIVLFSKKPKRVSKKKLLKSYWLPKDRYPTGYYDCLAQESIIIGDMELSSFQQMFTLDLSRYLNDGRPKDTEIIEVFQLELTAQFDEGGKLPCFHNDWK